MDIITLGTIVLLALGIGLWLFFRSGPSFNNRYSKGIDGFNYSSDGTLTPKTTF